MSLSGPTRTLISSCTHGIIPGEAMVRHSGERRYPGKGNRRNLDPAYAGMTGMRVDSVEIQR